MFENDYPLLSTPTLTALALHEAAGGEVTLEACLGRLHALLLEARETPAVPPEALRERFATHIRQLEIARLLEPAGAGAWRLTARGRDALERRPRGIDPTDLMEYPEYAAHIRAAAQRHADMDPRGASYDEGYDARRDGLPYTANPYTLNMVDYLSWENGWMQALDDEQQR